MPFPHSATFFVAVSASLASSAFAGQTDANWQVMETDGLCATGTPYQYYVHQGESTDMTIFFNGGGACWFGQQCDLESEPVTHLPFAQMPENNPENFAGMLDLAATGNPFADDTIVVLPYCTGDVHVGGGVQEYSYAGADDAQKTVTVQHVGAANAQKVLGWVYENVTDPARITVAGVSAGGIGASFYSGLIAEHYPDTPVVLIGASDGGYGSPNLKAGFTSWNTAAILPDWPEYAGKTNETLSFEDFYIASARHNPNLTIAQINSANDELQTQFTWLFGDAPDSFRMSERILNNLVEIESGVDDLASYTAGGPRHVLLIDPAYDDYVVEGTRLSDWVEALASGQSVADVSCVSEAKGCEPAPG